MYIHVCPFDFEEKKLTPQRHTPQNCHLLASTDVLYCPKHHCSPRSNTTSLPLSPIFFLLVHWVSFIFLTFADPSPRLQSNQITNADDFNLTVWNWNYGNNNLNKILGLTRMSSSTTWTRCSTVFWLILNLQIYTFITSK